MRDNFFTFVKLTFARFVMLYLLLQFFLQWKCKSIRATKNHASGTLLISRTGNLRMSFSVSDLPQLRVSICSLLSVASCLSGFLPDTLTLLSFLWSILLADYFVCFSCASCLSCLLACLWLKLMKNITYDSNKITSSWCVGLAVSYSCKRNFLLLMVWKSLGLAVSYG